MSKTLKIVAIIFFALTASMNLLGGIGTTCAAFIDKFSSVLGVLDYQWLYQIFVVTTVLLGIAGIWATVKF